MSDRIVMELVEPPFDDIDDTKELLEEFMEDSDCFAVVLKDSVH